MSDREPSRARMASQSAYRMALDVVLSGIVVILPLIVTLYVLNMAMNVITAGLNPVIKLLRWGGLIQGIKQNGGVSFLVQIGVYQSVTDFLTEIIALAVLVMVVVTLGAIARFQYGQRVLDLVDAIIMAVPGVGVVYRSFRRMGDAMLESDVENFREVKLVEFPHDEVFVIGFETNTSPPTVQAAAEFDGMTTLFLPLAPNPVMGGFLTHIPDERVRDVDMSVEEAVRTVITSGIATEEGEEYRTLRKEERDRLGFLRGGD